jgi:hypothetical protein
MRIPAFRRRWTVGHLSAENPAKNRASSEFEIDAWAVSQFVVDRLVPIIGTHPFPLHEQMLMVASVCRLEPSEIFEWGTNIGVSARLFSEAASHYLGTTLIHSIDLPDDVDHVEHPHGERGRLVKGRSNVRLYLGDGLDTSLELWRTGGRKPAPLFFLDGDHARGSVARELNGIMNDVPTAAMLIHDSFFQDRASGYNVGPHEAIAEALAAHEGRYLKIHSGLGLPGLTLLYPSVPLSPSRP